MSYWLAVVAGLIAVYGLVSKRLGTTVLTGPIFFVAAGLAVGTEGLAVITEVDAEAVTLLLEATLAVVLFSDAMAINPSCLREEAAIPGRLLGWGLPLTIVAGLAAAVMLFSDLGFWEAALIGAILAPTDAALGQAVISNPKVPLAVRQGLNVESGLNDGIALPVVLVFLSAAEESAGLMSAGDVATFIAKQILLAAAIGIALGWLGGRAMVAARQRGWASHMSLRIAALALAAAGFGLALPVDGSGFIAAWVVGLVLHAVTRHELPELSEFSETLGSAMTLASFLVFGAVLLGPALGDLTWQVVVYAVLSLTVIRIVPVAVAMLGHGLKPPTIAYLGWFGPRGLASIIFAGLVLEAELPGGDVVVTVIVFTVALSVLVHGMTAWEGSQRYGAWYAAREDSHAEMAESRMATVSVPVRFRSPHLHDEEHGFG